MQHAVRYAVTVDAGSSGSRVHVHHYYYNHNNIPTFNPVSKTLKVKPGLSTFIHTPKQGANSIKPLLEFAQDNIPEPYWENTPVFIKATAGLRAVDNTLAEQVLEECRNLLKTFPFVFDPQHVRIISGTYEGIYGWVATNYLVGTFNDDSPKQPIGVLEMGGASIQVSFVPKNMQLVDKSDLQPVKIGEKEFHLYTYSFLNYGLESAQSLLVQKIKESSKTSQPNNPCYPPGMEYLGTKGTGDYEVCSSMLDSIIDKGKTCPVRSCSFNGIFQPKVTEEKFYAIENFFYTSEFFGTYTSKTPVSSLREQGKAFCKTSWEDVKKTYVSEKEPEDQLQKYCFSSAYIPKILGDGFGIPNPDNSVTVVRTIGKAAIDWALGSVIHEVVNNPKFLPQSDHDRTLRVPIENESSLSFENVIAVGILAILAYILYHYFASKKSMRGNNNRVIPLSRVSS
jgi:hypothetical protein